MRNLIKQNQKGFTLIEILVVIGILSILLAIVLIAINPQQQFQQANNTRRSSDVSAILNAISSYSAQNNGDLPTGITSTATAISSTGADLCDTLVPDFIADLPSDPTSGTVTGGDTPCDSTTTAYDTGYMVQTSAGNRVTVSAPDAQGGETISITR